MLSLRHLHRLADQFADALDLPVREFPIGNRPFHFASRPHLMGVINRSPDSWYRESVCLTLPQTVARARLLAAQGADLIDVGAESTLPNAARLDPALHAKQAAELLRELNDLDSPISIETYDPAVAEAVLLAGARVLNLTGTKDAEAVFRAAAAHDAAVILCYVEGAHARDVADFDLSRDPIEAMYAYFSRHIERAAAAGLTKLILDPGLGFYYANLGDGARRVRHQMSVLLGTFRLRRLGFPICHALPHAFEFFGEEVRCAEPFFAVLAALGQASVFRTHEVPRVKAVLDTLSAY